MTDVRVGGAWKPVDSAEVRLGGQWKRILSVSARVGGVWKQIASYAPAMSASVSPAAAAGLISGLGDCTTNSVTVTPSGGLAPFTYAWAKVSGEGAVDRPSSATTAFTDNLALNESTSGAFRCTVTDSAAQTATVDVAANFASFFEPPEPEFEG